METTVHQNVKFKHTQMKAIYQQHTSLACVVLFDCKNCSGQVFLDALTFGGILNYPFENKFWSNNCMKNGLGVFMHTTFKLDFDIID